MPEETWPQLSGWTPVAKSPHQLKLVGGSAGISDRRTEPGLHSIVRTRWAELSLLSYVQTWRGELSLSSIIRTRRPTVTRSMLPYLLEFVAVAGVATIMLSGCSREHDGEPTSVPDWHVRTDWLHIEDKLYLVELINAERSLDRQAPVVLGRNDVAQRHAEASIEGCFSSHWDLDVAIVSLPNFTKLVRQESAVMIVELLSEGIHPLNSFRVRPISLDRACASHLSELPEAGEDLWTPCFRMGTGVESSWLQSP